MMNLKELFRNLMILVGILLFFFFLKYPDREAPDAAIGYGLCGFSTVFIMVMRNLLKSNKRFISKNKKEGKSYLIIAVTILIVGVPICIVLGNLLVL